MKILPVIMGLALLTIFSASAQVSVELALNQNQFLPSESVPLAVKIINRSGQPVHFGSTSNWLTFNVESTDDFIVVKNADVPVLGGFDLESSQMATKHVDLQPYFVMTKPGRYKVTATVRIPEWQVQVTSPALAFDVVDGVKLWEQNFGVPTTGNSPPTMRKYTLEEANYLRTQLRLYVSVSDTSGANIFKVSALGALVSFSQPEAQVDRLGRLHVLWQSGAQSFAYTVVNPDGGIVQREIYDYFNTRPRLTLNDAGDVMVTGGVRRANPDEIPQVKPPNELAVPAKP